MTTTVSTTSELTNAIKNKGGEIELTEDTTYSISSNIVSGRSCQIYGPKDRSAILKIGNRVQWATQVPMIRFNNADGLVFDHINFDGNFANSRKARGDGYQTFIRCMGCSDIEIDSNYMHDNAGDGFRLDRCTEVDCHDNDISKLGHEFIYAIYSCSDMDFYNNDILNYCNSGIRLDSSASDVTIAKNTIHSIITSASTGPGIELAKGFFDNIVIESNTIRDENGSGIWISADRATCRDCSIVGNKFLNVGNFLNGSGKYNGYSNAGIAGAGMDGLLIENNIFEDIKVGYAILMAEAKHAVSGNYAWKFKNNVLKNVKTGFRISNSRGSISGDGNIFTNVKTMKYGIANNINVTEKEIIVGPTEEPIEEPITNSEETDMSKMKYTLNLATFEGEALKVNTSADVQAATKQSGNLITGYVVFTTDSGYTTGRIPIKAEMKKQ